MTSHTDQDQLGGFERRLLAALTRIDQQRQPASQQASVPTTEPHRRPRRPRLRRALLATAVLAGVLAVTTTAVATRSNHAVLDVGGAVAPGGVALVKGAGCREGSTVTFTLDDKVRLGVTKAAEAEGLFFAELRIPAATPLGEHRLTAVCTGGDGKRLVQHAKLLIGKPRPEPPPAPFFDVAEDPEDPVAPGGVAVVKGAGCRAGSTVTFTLDDKTRLGVTKAYAGGPELAGLFDSELRIPAATPLGEHKLTAVCTGRDGKRLVQHAKLPISKPWRPEGPVLEVAGPAVPGWDADGPHPHSFAVVKGAGCRAGSAVTFALDDKTRLLDDQTEGGKVRLEVTKAQAGGVFHANLPILPGTPLGEHKLTAVCTGGDGKRLVQHAKLLIVSPIEIEPPPLSTPEG
jgi:hypothetical protein